VGDSHDVSSGQAQVALDFELDSEPISGCLRDASGTTAFNGWIELVSLLQEVATTGKHQVDGPVALEVVPWPETGS
jgi:hypothetical protein